MFAYDQQAKAVRTESLDPGRAEQKKYGGRPAENWQDHLCEPSHYHWSTWSIHKTVGFIIGSLDGWKWNFPSVLSSIHPALKQEFQVCNLNNATSSIYSWSTWQIWGVKHT